MIGIITLVMALVLLMIVNTEYVDIDTDNGKLYSDLKERNHYVWDLKERNHYVWATILFIATTYNLVLISIVLVIWIELIIWSNFLFSHVIFIWTTILFIATMVIVVSEKLFNYLYE